MRHVVLAMLVAVLLAGCERAGEPPLRVAVAANFATPFESVREELAAVSGVELEAVVGSTGLLAAQIENGAPFDLFLAADAARPAHLDRIGRAAEGGRATYAFGRLAIVGSALDPDVELATLLADPGVQRLAIANPALAPYGVAAMEVLEATGLLAAFEGRLVRGENVGQVFTFASTGGVELAFVALSQARAAGVPHREVSTSLHSSIRQDAVVLRGARSTSAAAVLAALTAPSVQRRMESFGYARADG